MLYNNQIEKLEALLNGPLLNEKILIIRVLPSIIRNLCRPNINEAEINTIAKVIIAGFPDNRNANKGAQDFCYRVIHDIFKHPIISDHTLTMLVKYLSAEPKVSLHKEEIKSIIADIHGGNRSIRNELLKQLAGKSKTMVRWLSSSIEDLKKEAEILVKEKVKPEIQSNLYSILLKKLAEDKSANNGREILETLKKYNVLKLEKHTINSGAFINLALKKCLIHGEIQAAKELWEMKKDTSDEIKLLYSLCLLEHEESKVATKSLETIEDFPSEQILLSTINQTNNISFATIEKFIELIYQRFSPIPIIIRKRLTQMLKKLELQKAIASDNLEKAYSVAANASELFKLAFGQEELMVACILKNEKLLLTKTFDLIVKFHDRNTASIDLMVAFLECGNYHSAAQLFEKSSNNLYINASKMEYITNREMELQRPDVLHKLFLLFNDPDSSSSIDLANMLTKCMNLYGIQKNLDGLKELRNDIDKTHQFNGEGKIKAHLEALIVGVNSKKNAESKSTTNYSSTSSACTSRSNSIFEHRNSKAEIIFEHTS